MEDANFKTKMQNYYDRVDELRYKIRTMEADPACDARELRSLKISLARTNASYARLQAKMANEQMWEERRFALVKETLSCVLSGPGCEMTPEQIADAAVAVADAVVAKMRLATKE